MKRRNEDNNSAYVVVLNYCQAMLRVGKQTPDYNGENGPSYLAGGRFGCLAFLSDSLATIMACRSVWIRAVVSLPPHLALVLGSNPDEVAHDDFFIRS